MGPNPRPPGLRGRAGKHVARKKCRAGERNCETRIAPTYAQTAAMNTTTEVEEQDPFISLKTGAAASNTFPDSNVDAYVTSMETVASFLYESETTVMQPTTTGEGLNAQLPINPVDRICFTPSDATQDISFETVYPTATTARIVCPESKSPTGIRAKTYSMNISMNTSMTKQTSKLKKRNVTQKPYTKGSICDLDLVRFFRQGTAPLMPLTITEECLAAMDSFAAMRDPKRAAPNHVDNDHPMGIRDTALNETRGTDHGRNVVVPQTQQTNAWYTDYYTSNTSPSTNGFAFAYISKCMTKLSSSHILELKAARERALTLTYTTIRRYLFIGVSLIAPLAGNDMLSHDFAGQLKDTAFPDDAGACADLTYDFLKSLDAMNMSPELQRKILVRSMTRCLIGHQAWSVFLNPAAFPIKHIPNALKDLGVIDISEFKDVHSWVFVELIATGLRIYAVLYATICSLQPITSCENDQSEERWTPEHFESILISESAANRHFEQATSTILSYMLSCNHASNEPACLINESQVEDSPLHLRTRRLLTHFQTLKPMRRTNCVLHPNKPALFTDTYTGIIDFLKSMQQSSMTLHRAMKTLNSGSLPGQWGKPFPSSAILYTRGSRSDGFDPCLVDDSKRRLLEQRKALFDANFLRLYLRNIIAALPQILPQYKMACTNTDTDDVEVLRRGIWEAVIAFGKQTLIHVLTDKALSIPLPSKTRNEYDDDDDCFANFL
ncbi:hypothetical protein FVE85_4587 [Porphyridium purpureum]|uniref:Uncharacterized protein n=1 Tax=Porphyridium purpureum TaxID=35688 RepID=A0A5J4YH26_PORPP|nr:hypothetical protein FVE85_4587 [Porphyridium purpureum]|eukprot:POR1253..scf252_32